jgi:uncharacterized membrane protein YqiK
LAQTTRQSLEKETSIADMQKEIVQAQQGVQIAERIAESAVKKASGEAQSIKIQAEAEAERVKMIAGADAEKVRLMGNAEAARTQITGEAEATKILAIGKSNAESYELQVKAMGGDSFTRLKIMEVIGKEGVKIIPEVLITGGGDGNGSGSSIVDLMGIKLLEQWKKDEKKD